MSFLNEYLNGLRLQAVPSHGIRKLFPLGFVRTGKREQTSLKLNSVN